MLASSWSWWRTPTTWPAAPTSANRWINGSPKRRTRVAEQPVPPPLRGTRGSFAAPVPTPSGADAFVRLAAVLGRRR
ncbi:hypothetical protein ACI78V_10990 [Geodermatophilus sp. SYSU D00742]